MPSGNTLQKGTIAIRWIARIMSALVILGILLIVIGEGGFNPFEFTAIEGVMMVFFWIAFAGLIIGWKWPGLGGMVTITGILAFFIVQLIVQGNIPHGFAFEVIALPGWLFLLTYLLQKLSAGKKSEVPRDV
jgi:hypothetical protein